MSKRFNSAGRSASIMHSIPPFIATPEGIGRAMNGAGAGLRFRPRCARPPTSAASGASVTPAAV